MQNRRPSRTDSFAHRTIYNKTSKGSSLRDGYKPPRDSTGSDGYSFRRTESNSPGILRNNGFGNTIENSRFKHGQSGFAQGRNNLKSRSPGSLRTRASKLRTPAIPIQISSDYQITDGKYRGRMLRNSSSPKALPTASRLRELLFRIIFKQIRAARFLDLCSGSGTIGFEAISRGAMLGTFVERSARMCSLIRRNMDDLGIKQGHGKVVETEIMPFLKRAAKRRCLWDVAYLDSCAETNIEEILNLFASRRILKPGGLLLVEHCSAELLAEKPEFLRKSQTLIHDERTLSFYEKR